MRTKSFRMPSAVISSRMRAPLWPPTSPVAITGSPRRLSALATFTPLPPAITSPCWALGHGALWLLMMTVAVTVTGTVWGVVRRRVPADIAGLEVALALGVMVVFGADMFPEAITAAACFAWLIRDGRTGQVLTSQ